MASRSFVQLSFRVLDNAKFRSLSSNDTRFLYLSLLANPFSNYIGLYHLRSDFIPNISHIDPGKINENLEELTQESLIEYDRQTEFIRLVGWFDKLNGPSSASASKRMIRDFLELENIPKGLFERSSLNFLFRLSINYRNWKDRNSILGEAHTLFERLDALWDGQSSIYQSQIFLKEERYTQNCLKDLISEIKVSSLEPSSKGPRGAPDIQDINEMISDKMKVNERIQEETTQYLRPTKETLNSALLQGLKKN